MLSSIVTVASQVDVLPFASVTVRVTVWAPTLLQSNVWSAPPPIVSVTAPQLSLLPLSICAAVMVTVPVASSWTVMF
jgi:hypothetical protein